MIKVLFNGAKIEVAPTGAITFLSDVLAEAGVELPLPEGRVVYLGGKEVDTLERTTVRDEEIVVVTGVKAAGCLQPA